jgi:hypothetical protein
MGAAVIIQPEERGRGRGRGGGGFDEVDAKFAAAEIAGWRARAERLGRDGDVVDAMASQEAELWAWWRDGVGEPPVLTASEPADADEADRVERVDSEQTVLALSADQMLAFGVADDRARDTAALGAIESLPGEHREDIDALGNYVEGYQRKVTRELRELEAVAERVNSILGRFDEGADGFEDVADVRRTLRRLLRDARNIEYRGRRYEYIELEIERHYGGMGAIRAWIGRIEDALERVRAM